MDTHLLFEPAFRDFFKKALFTNHGQSMFDDTQNLLNHCFCSGLS